MIGFGLGGGMSLFFILFFLMFAVVIVVFIFSAVRGVGQWHKNNQSPVLDVEAAIVAKRADVSTYTNVSDGTGAPHSRSSTRYYATFEFASGDRLELELPAREYGFLAERDHGILRFQGTRYLSFQRT